MLIDGRLIIAYTLGMSKDRDTIVDEAIAAAGGPSALCRELGIRPEATYSWKRIPAARVLQVEAASGISRHLLRPDLYPEAPKN